MGRVQQVTPLILDLNLSCFGPVDGTPNNLQKWFYCDDDDSVLDYELLDVEVPTINIVGSLVKAGVPVLVYR